MLPANMLGEIDIEHALRLIDPLALQAQQRQALFPLALALAAIRHFDRGIAIVVALDEPFEAEIDQRRRVDHQFARFGLDRRFGGMG